LPACFGGGGGFSLFFFKILSSERNGVDLSIKLRFQAILLRLPALLIAAVIWFLSSQQTLPQPKGIFGWDKLQHFAVFALLAAAIGFWVSPAFGKRRPALSLFLVALVGSAYGAIDELHQYFVPGRYSSSWDWLADTLGAFFGAVAVVLFMRRIKSSKA